MYEKNVLNSYHFLHYTHPKFYTQKFAMHPDKTSELLSTKLNLNLVYSLYSFSLISLRKYENFQKVISAGFLDVNQRLPVSFVCVNRNSRFYNQDIDLQTLQIITALSEVFRPGLCKDSTENPPQKKLGDFNSVSQKWSKALISPSQVKTMQSQFGQSSRKWT